MSSFKREQGNWYSLASTSKLSTFFLVVCSFMFKSKTFPNPRSLEMLKKSLSLSPWLFLFFQMSFSIANHFEGLPDHLTLSPLQHNTDVCMLNTFRWNNVPCKKQNWHPGCWWKTLGFLFLKWITSEAINHIYIYISSIGHHISCSKIVNASLRQFSSSPLSTPSMSF